MGVIGVNPARFVTEYSGQSFAQGKSSSQQSNFHVRFRDLEQVGRLFDGESLDVAKHEHGPVVLAQVAERPINERSNFMPLNQIGRIIAPPGNELGVRHIRVAFVWIAGIRE